MKTTRTTVRAVKAEMAAASWDAVWGAFRRAEDSGDAELLKTAKADAALWHSSRGLKVPAQFQ